MKLTASTCDDGGNGGVREAQGLTGRLLVALDRVGEQWIGGEADTQKI